MEKGIIPHPNVCYWSQADILGLKFMRKSDDTVFWSREILFSKRCSETHSLFHDSVKNSKRKMVSSRKM